MTGMDSKKAPSKFTLRFNLDDPQQRQAVELLNRQGRSKAQFIASALLCYVGGQPQLPQGTPPVDREQLRGLVEDILAQRQSQHHEKTPAAQDTPVDDGAFSSTERSLIFKTLDAFQKQ